MNEADFNVHCFPNKRVVSVQMSNIAVGAELTGREVFSNHE